jgi:transposase
VASGAQPVDDGLWELVKPLLPDHIPQRPDRIVADRGYEHDNYRRELWRSGVEPSIDRRLTKPGSRLERWPRAVERILA